MPQYGTDQEILQVALEWRQQRHEVIMVTVLKTWGSSPRPVGSMMIMRADGMCSGSISGGCVEQDLLQRYREQQLSGLLPTRLNYGVNRLDATRFGLPCGGRLELLIEKLEDTGQLQELIEAIRQHQLMARQVDLHTGQIKLFPPQTELTFSYTDRQVTKLFGPRWHMLIIGAGHLSQYVSQLALMLDYHVIVCEPREEYASAWNVTGTELTTLMPDDAVLAFANHPRSLVIALTHDPKLDDLALLDALSSPAFYVGAIGSKRNCEQRGIRLKKMGITNQQLQHLHAPIGLAIGSHTPPEIAVSIMAEITHLRNSVNNTISASSISSACL